MPDRILVIEDDEATRYAYERALADAGYRSSGYANYLLAASDIDKGAGRLLIIDLRLPDRTPQGVSIALMARWNRPRLPVIFVTGYPELVEHIPAGIGPVLLKPVDLRQLVAMVHEKLAT